MFNFSQKGKKDGLSSRRKCARQGVLDGRNGIPDETWISQKPPFLLDLQNQGRIAIEAIEAKLHSSEDSYDASLAQLKTEEIAALHTLELSEKLAKNSQSDFDEAMSLERISDDELGESRSVKFRTFSTPLYLILLFVMGAGEFAITRAAFGYLLNDDPNTAFAMTSATVAVSIGFAHLTGIAWKRSHDKVNFPTDSVFTFWKVLGIFMILFVTSLAAARAAKSPVFIDGVKEKVDLISVFSKAPVYVVIFFILQFILILVATGASYNHYSLPLERIGVMEKRAKRSYKKQVKTLKSLQKIRHNIEHLEKSRPRLILNARNEVRALIHKYHTLAQSYQAANLRARSKTISQALAAFSPPQLDTPQWYSEDPSSRLV
jgi:hypothetical protein